MPNRLNERMLREIQSFLGGAEDCVVVDFTGQTVAQARNMRVKLRGNRMHVRVLKTSLARLAARELGFEGGDRLFEGTSAVVYGGDSVATVARIVREVGKEQKTGLKVRGGFLEKKAIGAAQVDQLASLPSREELLSQVLGTIIAPVSGWLGAVNALLSAVPGLTQALHDKSGAKDS
jgi:large subunit ribosomal protein L10